MIRAFSATICVLITFIGGFSQASYHENELAINSGLIDKIQLKSIRLDHIDANDIVFDRTARYTDFRYKYTNYLDAAKSGSIGCELGIAPKPVGLYVAPYIQKKWLEL